MLLASLLHVAGYSTIADFPTDLAVLLLLKPIMFNLSLLLLSSLIFIVSLLKSASMHAVAGFPVLCWRSGPVVAFIPAINFIPADADGRAITVIFAVACCLCHCY